MAIRASLEHPEDSNSSLALDLDGFSLGAMEVNDPRLSAAEDRFALDDFGLAVPATKDISGDGMRSSRRTRLTRPVEVRDEADGVDCGAVPHVHGHALLQLPDLGRVARLQRLQLVDVPLLIPALLEVRRRANLKSKRKIALVSRPEMSSLVWHLRMSVSLSLFKYPSAARRSSLKKRL
jgi:hypothetical protein